VCAQDVPNSRASGNAGSKPCRPRRVAAARPAGVQKGRGFRARKTRGHHCCACFSAALKLEAHTNRAQQSAANADERRQHDSQPAFGQTRKSTSDPCSQKSTWDLRSDTQQSEHQTHIQTHNKVNIISGVRQERCARLCPVCLRSKTLRELIVYLERLPGRTGFGLNKTQTSLLPATCPRAASGTAAPQPCAWQHASSPAAACVLMRRSQN
jgi:hypothetical protein